MAVTKIPIQCPACGKVRLVWKQQTHRQGFSGTCRECWKGSRFTHGQSDGGPLYHRWNGMKQRCQNPHSRGFKNYGGRGISIHPAWLDFERFRDDILREIGPCPSPEHELDRIDNDGNYEPGNVRWSTAQEQCNNKRSNRTLTLNGESHTVAEWARILSINVWTLWERIDMGWSDERTLTQPLNQRYHQVLTLNGESHPAMEWARILNINVYTLWKRLEMGRPVERALTQPVRKYRS